MNPASVETVLHEARTLAHYALRTGKLATNTRLVVEIDLVTQAQARGEQPALAALMSEMQQASRAAHITLDQLMYRNALHSRVRRWLVVVAPYVLGILTLCLTLYLAFQSSELHKADLALREYQEMEGERLPEKIYRAWKLYYYEDVLFNVHARPATSAFDFKGPALAQLDGYQELVSDLKRLYQKRRAIQDLLLDSAVIRYIPDNLQRTPPTDLRDLGKPVDLKPTSSGTAGSGEVTPTLSDVTPKGNSLERYNIGVPLDSKGDPLNCSEETLLEPPSSLIEGRSGKFGSTEELERFRQSIDCYVQSLQIQSDYDYPMVSIIYATRSKVNLLVSWMLPGLYGLLGACVFVMRDLLRGSGLRTVRSEVRIVDTLSLLLRVALGGLAGIIIGWFWVPTSASPNSSVIPVSSVSFGLAFLAGFSIDSLFSLLDRLTRSLSQPREDIHTQGVKKTNSQVPKVST